MAAVLPGGNGVVEVILDGIVVDSMGFVDWDGWNGVDEVVAGGGTDGVPGVLVFLFINDENALMFL